MANTPNVTAAPPDSVVFDILARLILKIRYPNRCVYREPMRVCSIATFIFSLTNETRPHSQDDVPKPSPLEGQKHKTK